MRRRNAILLFVAVLSAVTFILIATNVNQQNEIPIDGISFWLSSYSSQVMTWISFLGSGEVLMILTFLMILWLWLKKGSFHQALLFFVVMGGGVLINVVLKFLFQRGRPDDVSYFDIFGLTFEWVSYSFPSGHAMRTFLFFGLLIYIIWLYAQHTFTGVVLTLLFMIVIFMVGISRVTLEAHFASDILAAFSISLAWLISCIVVFQIFYDKYKKVETQTEIHS